MANTVFSPVAGLTQAATSEMMPLAASVQATQRKRGHSSFMGACVRTALAAACMAARKKMNVPFQASQLPSPRSPRLQASRVSRLVIFAAEERREK